MKRKVSYSELPLFNIPDGTTIEHDLIVFTMSHSQNYWDLDNIEILIDGEDINNFDVFDVGDILTLEYTNSELTVKMSKLKIHTVKDRSVVCEHLPIFY